MKRYLFIFLCLLCTLAQAQDTYVIHYKDGSTQQIPHGIYTGSLSLWNLETGGQTGRDFKTYSSIEMSVKLGNSFRGNVTLQEDDDVTAVWKDTEGKGIYTVLLLMPATAPTSLPYRLCLGISPGQDIEHTDTLLTLANPAGQDAGTQVCISVGLGERLVDGYATGSGSIDGLIFNYGYSNNNFQIPLLHGETYYYRLVASIPTMCPGGQCDTVLVYGPELSFRIPDLAAESGAVPQELVREEFSLPSSEAWEQFLNTHFLGSTKQVADRGLCELWQEWMQTDEGNAAISSLPTSLHEYDDARVTFYQTIPDAFDDWLRHREIIITDPDEYVGATNLWEGVVYTQTKVEFVSDTQSEWDNPSDHFMRISRAETADMHFYPSSIFVSLRHVIPDVTYRMSITFAPESDTETYTDKPCIVTITHVPYTPRVEHIPNARTATQLYVSPDEGIPATKPTQLSFDIPANELVDKVLNIYGSSSIQISLRGATDVFRIAEIRLTPIE